MELLVLVIIVRHLNSNRLLLKVVAFPVTVLDLAK